MIYAMLADGFEEIEAITFIDILRRADIDIKTVSINESHKVTGAHGITVLADYKLSDSKLESADGIYLPGGMPGTLNLKENKQLADVILKFDSQSKYLIAICAAPMILGELNILQSKKATCYPSFEKYLHGAECLDYAVCVDNNILTSKGAGTAHELAFKFVEILKGKEASLELRASMQYE